MRLVYKKNQSRSYLNHLVHAVLWYVFHGSNISSLVDDSAIDQTAYIGSTKEIPQKCMYKSSWRRRLGCSKNVDGTIKVKVTLVQALRLCTGRTAHRGSRGIALPFLDHGTSRGWGVSVTPRPFFTPGKDSVPIVQKAGWAPGPVWTGAENLTTTGIRSPNRQARSQSPHRLSYWDPKTLLLNENFNIRTVHYVGSYYTDIIRNINYFLILVLQSNSCTIHTLKHTHFNI
jgi:hypothetical protein